MFVISMRAMTRHGGLGVVLLATWITSSAAGFEAPIALSPEQQRGGNIVTQVLGATDARTAGNITLTGRVEMGESGPDPVLAPAAAMVVAIYAHPGDHVARGAPLIAVAGSGAVALRQSLQEAETTFTTAQQRADRDEALYSAGVIALGRLEQTRAAAIVAKTQRASMRQLLGSSQFDAGGRLVLRAPRAGFVSGPAFGTGDSVAVGDLIAHVGKPLTPLVSLDAPATVARSLHVGDALSVRNGDCRAIAALHAIGRTVDSGTQTVALHGELEGPSCLLPGEIVTATVSPRAQGGDAFALPASAFVRRGNSTFVFLRSSRGYTPVAVDAEAARSGFARAESLHGDSQVVVQGTALLKAEWLKRSAG